MNSTQAKVIMYTRVPCPYCVAAKRFFANHGIEFQEIDLTDDMDKLFQIKKDTGWQTVPIILINGQLIGGYNDLKALHEEGKLENILNT